MCKKATLMRKDLGLTFENDDDEETSRIQLMSVLAKRTPPAPPTGFPMQDARVLECIAACVVGAFEVQMTVILHDTGLTNTPALTVSRMSGVVMEFNAAEKKLMLGIYGKDHVYDVRQFFLTYFDPDWMTWVKDDPTWVTRKDGQSYYGVEVQFYFDERCKGQLYLEYGNNNRRFALASKRAYPPFSMVIHLGPPHHLYSLVDDLPRDYREALTCILHRKIKGEKNFNGGDNAENFRGGFCIDSPDLIERIQCMHRRLRCPDSIARYNKFNL